MNIKTLLLSALVLLGTINTLCWAQNPTLLRSTLGVAGSNKLISTKTSNIFIAQSIGQGSVIGSYASNKKVIHQGYLQTLGQSTEITKLLSIEVSIFPNPFESELVIQFKELIKDNPTLSIINLKGQIIYNKQFQANQKMIVNLEGINSGVYVLLIRVGAREIQHKIIKK